MTRRQVRRWHVGLVATLALAGVGLLYANETLLAAAVIPLAYVFYGTLSRLPDDVQLSATRQIEPRAPTTGDRVEVTLTVENAGESVLPDVRLLDGVPEELAVDGGTPRLCSSLSPGESRTVTYSVVATRGTFEFDDPVVRLRSLAGVDRLTTELDVEGDTRMTCARGLSATPRQGSVMPHTGTLATDSGGTGLELHSTRQYKPGDPVSRIDWHQVAKTGEFITVQYREEKTSRTVLILDARPVNRVSPRPGYPTGVGLAAYAGEQLYGALTSAGVHASVAAVGLDWDDGTQFGGLPGPDGLAWVDPDGDGRNGRARAVFDAVSRASTGKATRLPFESPVVGSARTDLNAPAGGTQPGSRGHTRGVSGGAGSDTAGQQEGRSRRAERSSAESVPTRTDGDGDVERLLARLPPNAQVVLCTPLLDNWPVALVEALLAREYAPLVVSPDVVDGPTPGQRIGAVHRGLRLRTLDRTGALTVDWSVEQPVEQALRTALPQLLARR